jgi:hypothetical protein
MTELVKILNNPEEHYPGNFDTPQRANALLTGLCQDAATEVERLNKALTWEQNRAERIGTHSPGCHTWGSQHYECLLRVNAELVEALNDIVYGLEKSRIWGGMDWSYHPMHPVNYLPLRDKARAALAKATGETK